MTPKRFIQQLALLSFLVLTMTGIDWVVHQLQDSWYVEPSYFTNKIIFGVIWAVVAVWVMRRVLRVATPRALAIGVPALVALILQTRYTYQGRPFWSFVFPFLFIHFLAFLPASFWIFSRFRSVFIQPGDVTRPQWLRFIVFLIILEGIFWLYFR